MIMAPILRSRKKNMPLNFIKKLNKLFIGLLIGCFSVCCCQAQDIYIPRFTNINPISYTDVIYTGIKDTVLVSTYSGRISRIINSDLKEKVITKIDDEIYALAYN